MEGYKKGFLVKNHKKGSISPSVFIVELKYSHGVYKRLVSFFIRLTMQFGTIRIGELIALLSKRI
ncbi:hypothetical protein CD32_20755 [Lysinibacillus odysseyi 34hs-1 = NBRC 100172]|uniref:Uncharacterized protein n=1 Tax=Lysinibacillus odysseyi 34hs-1 = NBRC 100172 TaxID=1220589 RepID=A0A0A3IG44_9BACI|nr:hypothetical protein CD32_20755 [Lysinibacillus odysseyi 34hs-1 = NBRC 100172]